MMEVEVLVTYRLVVRVDDARAWSLVAEQKAANRLPRGAYDVKVEALHMPPATAVRVRYAE